ncbi:hypothetical protein OPQ81_002507 [Rhizoctonia solani]|nr:hypothetical protein OPQ81_002507 [Rhizoctonia solani]
MDSKGLEFDDVLIYNFFSQSPAPIAAWEYISGTTRWNQAPPPVLCSELKLLYVAVTRARRRCWIWDSGSLVEQLQDMWLNEGLVKTEPSSLMVGRLGVSSNKAQWSAKGREYFAHRLYKLAAACFRQAEQTNNAKLSTAYHLMSRAKLKRLRGDSPALREELSAAATELVTCAELPGIGDPKPIYFHAATCFQAAQKLLPAASAFAKAGRAADGIHILFEAHDYKSATNLLVDNREAIEDDVFEELCEEVRAYLFDHREYNLVFDSIDEKIAYARRPQYRTQLKHILAEHQRYHELAEELLIEQKLVDAVQYFIKAYQYHGTRSSVVRAADLTIEHTEAVLLVEATYRKNDQDLAKSLLEIVQPFACCVERESYLKIDLFYSYLCFDYVSIEMVRAWNQTSLTHRSMRTLASYFAIKSNSWLKAETVEILMEYLGALEIFKANIIQIINTSRPCASLFAQKVLGFTPTESSISSYDSFEADKASLVTHHRYSKATSLVSGSEVDTIIRGELPKRLHRLLESFHTAALDSPHVQPSVQPKFVNAGCDYTTVDRQWLGRMFEIIYLVTGELEQLDLGGNLSAIFTRLQDWFARDWAQLCKSGGVSTGSITHLLLHFLVRSGLQIQLSQQNAPWSMAIGTIPGYDSSDTIVRPLKELFWGQKIGRVDAAASVVQHILVRSDRPDATIMIHFIETLTREIIIRMNPARQPEFDGLLIPLSWAQSLVRKYKNLYGICTIECLDDLCSAIRQISVELRFGSPGLWQVAGERITPLFGGFVKSPTMLVYFSSDRTHGLF